MSKFSKSIDTFSEPVENDDTLFYRRDGLLFARQSFMENTYTVYVDCLNEQWEMPDKLALKWQEYETENPLAPDGSNADKRHTAWFETLSPEDRRLVTRHKPEE